MGVSMTWLDRLLVESPGLPVGTVASDSTLDALSSGLPPEDAQALREERAGILEHQAAHTRREAERRAGLSCMTDPHGLARPPPPRHIPSYAAINPRVLPGVLNRGYRANGRSSFSCYVLPALL